MTESLFVVGVKVADLEGARSAVHTAVETRLVVGLMDAHTVLLAV